MLNSQQNYQGKEFPPDYIHVALDAAAGKTNADPKDFISTSSSHHQSSSINQPENFVAKKQPATILVPSEKNVTKYSLRSQVVIAREVEKTEQEKKERSERRKRLYPSEAEEGMDGDGVAAESIMETHDTKKIFSPEILHAMRDYLARLSTEDDEEDDDIDERDDLQKEESRPEVGDTGGKNKDAQEEEHRRKGFRSSLHSRESTKVFCNSTEPSFVDGQQVATFYESGAKKPATILRRKDDHNNNGKEEDPNKRYIDIDGNLNLLKYNTTGQRNTKNLEKKKFAPRKSGKLFEDHLSDGFGSVDFDGVLVGLPLMKARFTEWVLKYTSCHLSLYQWIPMLLEDLDAATLAPPGKDSDGAFLQETLVSGDGRHASRMVASTTPQNHLLQQHSRGKGESHATNATSLMPHSISRPNSLRVATALFIVREMFERYNIPLDIFDDLLSGIYLNGGGAFHEKMTTTSSKKKVEADADPARRAVEKYDFMGKSLVYKELIRTRQNMVKMKQQISEILQEVDHMKDQLRDSKESARIASLRVHFQTWKNCKKNSAWKQGCVLMTQYQRNLLRKANAFKNWFGCVTMARQEKECNITLQKMVEAKKENEKLFEEMKANMNHHIREMESKLHQAMKKAGNHQMSEEEMEENNQRVQLVVNLEAELSSLQRRNGELEAMVKFTKGEKEKAVDLAGNAAEALRRAVCLTIAGRNPTGVKASDIQLNAEALAKGNLSTFHVSSTAGSDIISLPFRCQGDHILLAWCNYVIQKENGGVFPKIYRIGTSFSDGMHYATLMKALFPNSKIGKQIESAHTVADRFNILMTQGSLLLLQRDIKPSITVQIPDLHSETSFSFSVRSDRDALMFNAQKDPGPLVTMGVTNLDLIDGREEAHFITLYLLFKCYYANFSITLLNDAESFEKVMEGEALDTRGLAHNISQVRESPLTILSSQSSSSQGMASPSLHAGSGGGTGFGPGGPLLAKIDTGYFFLNLAQRSLSSWKVLLQHVEDYVVGILYKLSTGQRAAQALLASDCRQESITKKFVLDPIILSVEDPDPQKLAARYIADLQNTNKAMRDRESSLLSVQSEPSGGVEGEGDMSSPILSAEGPTTILSPGKGAGGTQRQRSVSIKLSEGEGGDPLDTIKQMKEQEYQNVEGARREMKVKKAATKSFVELVPKAQDQRDLTQLFHLHAELFYQVFRHYSEKSAFMSFAAFETFCADCQCYVTPDLLSRGFGERVARSYGTYTTSNLPGVSPLGLHPSEFVVSLFSVIEDFLPLVANVSTDVRVNTPARRFSFFISNYIYRFLRLTAVENVRRVFQDPNVQSSLQRYQSALKILFDSFVSSLHKSTSNVASIHRKRTDSKAGSQRRGSGSQGEQSPTTAGADDGPTLTLSEWLKFSRDMDMCDSTTNQHDLTSIFTNSQDEFDNSGESQMSFSEFTEAVIALALFRVNNPYYTMAEKIHVFFNDRLMAQIRKKFSPIYMKMSAALKEW